jgi:GABA permease
MWLFPVLSILTAVAMVAILVQMFLDDSLRSQLVLSLLSWAVVLGLFFLNKRYNTSHHINVDAAEAEARVLLN